MCCYFMANRVTRGGCSVCTFPFIGCLFFFFIIFFFAFLLCHRFTAQGEGDHRQFFSRKVLCQNVCLINLEMWRHQAKAVTWVYVICCESVQSADALMRQIAHFCCKPRIPK